MHKQLPKRRNFVYIIANVPINTFLVSQFSAEFHYVYDQFNVDLSSQNLMFGYFNISPPNIY